MQKISGNQARMIYRMKKHAGSDLFLVAGRQNPGAIDWDDAQESGELLLPGFGYHYRAQGKYTHPDMLLPRKLTKQLETAPGLAGHDTGSYVPPALVDRYIKAYDQASRTRTAESISWAIRRLDDLLSQPEHIKDKERFMAKKLELEQFEKHTFPSTHASVLEWMKKNRGTGFTIGL